MTDVMNDFIKGAFRAAGYRIERWRPANRFDGMRDSLEMLHNRGYRPLVIVDAGANVGRWTEMARAVFPDAAVHLVEPQPACRAALEQLTRQHRALTLHPIALTEPGRSRLAFAGGTAYGGTGAYVIPPGSAEQVEIECPASTLDDLFAATIVRADRTLLKLDLEGHELAALRGAERLLDVVEVIVCEAQVYDINDSGSIPVFRDIWDVLAARGFELHDLATLGQRKRDRRLCMLDAVFARADSALCADRAWA